MLKGKNIYIKVATKEVKTYATSHKLSIQNQLSAISHKGSSAGVVDNEMTGKNWSITFDNLLHSTDNVLSDLTTKLTAGTEVDVKVFAVGDANALLQGTAVVVDINKNYPNKENSTYSGTLQGKEGLSLTSHAESLLLEVAPWTPSE